MQSAKVQKGKMLQPVDVKNNVLQSPVSFEGDYSHNLSITTTQCEKGLHVVSYHAILPASLLVVFGD